MMPLKTLANSGLGSLIYKFLHAMITVFTVGCKRMHLHSNVNMQFAYMQCTSIARRAMMMLKSMANSCVNFCMHSAHLMSHLFLSPNTFALITCTARCNNRLRYIRPVQSSPFINSDGIIMILIISPRSDQHILRNKQFEHNLA